MGGGVAVMTPAEIAARLTPAQIRALRARSDMKFCFRVDPRVEVALNALGLFWLGRPSKIGRAVLAAIDGAAK